MGLFAGLLPEWLGEREGVCSHRLTLLRAESPHTDVLSCCNPSSTACWDTHGHLDRCYSLLALNLAMERCFQERKSKMPGLPDETGTRNPTSQSFCYPSSKHLCLVPCFSFEGCVHVPLLVGTPCCCTSCRPAGESFVLPLPTTPLCPWFPLPQEGTGSAGHLSARSFASLTESSTSLLKTGGVFQAGGDSRSACLRLSSDSSVCS